MLNGLVMLRFSMVLNPGLRRALKENLGKQKSGGAKHLR